MEEDEPIINFPSLRNTLRSMGINVPKHTGNTYKIVDPTTVTFEDIQNGSLIVTPDHISFKDNDGIEHEGFIYKKYYSLYYNSRPVFHICECRTIREFKEIGRFDSDYVFYNSSPVDVYDLHNHNRVSRNNVLRLCQNCIRQLSNVGVHPTYRTTDEFVAELKERAGDENVSRGPVEVRDNGMTRDWEKIERDYRKHVHHTCEKCHTQVLSMKDKKRFLHVIHLNGKGADNRISNLRCLCPKCHSQSDIEYRKLLQSDTNARKDYDEFLRNYTV